MSNIFSINMDAFSDGQIGSKLWLCEHLEESVRDKKISSAWIYGSWYGVLTLLLLSRGRILPEEVHLFDIDRKALKVSEKILDHWKISGTCRIHFHYHDCTTLPVGLKQPDLLINTSVEHFHNFQWWDPIAKGTLCALQSTNMIHEEHVNPINSLEEFKIKMGFSSPVIFEGTKDFKYPGFEFTRFMVIGNK